ncbi:hypothetical protein ACF0H5_021282 [Mactra antiquata]
MESDDELEDIILKKLQQYGDSVVGKNDTSSKNKSTKSEVQSLNNEQRLSVRSDDKPSKKKRKKKKKKHVAMVTESVDSKSQDTIGLSGHERKLHEMSAQLGLNEFKHKLEEDAMEAKEEESESKIQNGPEVVVFKSYKSKKDKDKESDNTDTQSNDKNLDFDMKKARAEVRRFGIGGLKGRNKQKAMNTLLVELGAKPPKNHCINYKQFQQKRKRDMVSEAEKRELDKKLGYKVPKLDTKNKRPKDRNDIGYIDGHIGKWKRGAVVISKNELKSVNKKPRLK